MSEEDEMVPGRWWHVITADGALLCETSDEAEARAVLRPGDTLQRLYVFADPRVEWRDVPLPAGLGDTQT